MLKRTMKAAILIGVLLTIATAQNNWPQFRGPGSLGVAEDPTLPDTWSATENVAWKTDIPGTGWSSPGPGAITFF